MEKILIVDADEHYAHSLYNYLVNESYDVDVALSLNEALIHLSKSDYDLIISCLNLNESDGVTLLLKARILNPYLVLIALADTISESAELKALQLKASLYLEKNKGIELTSVYIRKLLDDRQKKLVKSKDDLYSRSENIVLRIDENIVLKDGEMVLLSPKEFDLLKLFLSNKEEILSRQEIIDVVWGSEELYESSRIVDVYIQKLRDKLNTFSIVTVRGSGYKWSE